MAVGVPSLLGNSPIPSNSAVATLATSACVIPANTLVVVCLGLTNVSGTDPGVPTCTDASSNLQVDASAVTTEIRSALFSRYYTAGVTKTFTCNFTSANDTFIYVYGISGCDPTTWLDTAGVLSGGTGTTATVSTTGNVAQADSIAIFGLARFTGTALTTWPPTNYTSLQNVVEGVRGRGYAIAYHGPTLTPGAVESASGWVMAGATDRAAALAVYKGAASSAAVQPVRSSVPFMSNGRI